MIGSDPASSSVVASDAPSSHGRRSRPLLLLERTMYRDGRTPFTSVFPIQVAGDLEESRLRQALARVQAKHPLLRCVVEESAGAPRFVMLDRPAPIPLRLVERGGEDDWQAVVRREWVIPFEASCEPLVRLIWVRGSGIHELALLGHHCVCDGHTGVTLIRELLGAYDQPDEELEAYGALGAMEDLLPAPVLDDPSFQRRVRWKAGILRLILLFKRARKPSAPIPAGQVYFRRWNAGRETARALTESCRREGVTVSASVSVAFMQAFRDVCGLQGLGKVSTMVDARRLLPHLRADAMFGLAPSIRLPRKGLPSPRDIDIGAFWTRARAVKADLMRRIERSGARLYETLAGLERLHDRYAAVVAYFEKAPAIRNVTISNLGRLDLPGGYRNFRLEKVFSPLVIVSPTPANTIVISSFAGEMEFAIISDEQSLPQARAIEIQQRAMEILAAISAQPPALSRGRAFGFDPLRTAERS